MGGEKKKKKKKKKKKEPRPTGVNNGVNPHAKSPRIGFFRSSQMRYTFIFNKYHVRCSWKEGFYLLGFR